MRKLKPVDTVRRTRITPDGAAGATLTTLERRLDEGYSRIEEAIARGEDVTAWESFWIDLLHQYEAEWDALPDAA
jgi:hypothetical protein